MNVLTVAITTIPMTMVAMRKMIKANDDDDIDADNYEDDDGAGDSDDNDDCRV